jgi:Ni/Fe-hydrogenase subunit HybB-like protein
VAAKQPQYADVNRDVLTTLAPPSRIYFSGLVVCELLVLAFLLMLTWQVDLGLGVTGLRTPQYWALYITNFVFWIGIGHVRPKR